MKKIMTALALAGVFVSAPALADKICLDIRQIASSDSKDGKTMVFKLKDGTTYVNHLRGYCPDLKFTGFVWQMPSSDINVCENQNSFRVLQSGQVCALGKFDPPTMEKRATK